MIKEYLIKDKDETVANNGTCLALILSLSSASTPYVKGH